jgi:hypothetical protein
MKARNYKHEYKMFQSSEKSKADRAERNRARREAGLAKGDLREVDHVRALAKGGSYAKSNRRVVSRHANRVKGKK